MGKVGGGLLAGGGEPQTTTVFRHSLLESADCCHPMASWRVTEDVRDKGARVCGIGARVVYKTRDIGGAEAFTITSPKSTRAFQCYGAFRDGTFCLGPKHISTSPLTTYHNTTQEH